MKFGPFLILLILTQCSFAQVFLVPVNSIFAKLKANDSIVVYQGHVAEGYSNLVTTSGQTLTGSPKKITVTEKFVITRIDSSYSFRYYQSPLSIFPNRKFSGLKIREKNYWDFKLAQSGILQKTDFEILVALEKKGREATEYEFPLNKYTTNQIIIKKGKDFKQLVIDGNYIISALGFKGGSN